MNHPLERNYVFLDSDTDREQFITQMLAARQDLLDFVKTIPENQWYEPHYHGWTLAALLGHLQWTDFLSKLAIQIAMMGMAIPIPSSAWNGLNEVMGGVFRRRVVETSLRGIEKNSDTIADFVRRVPVNHFGKHVYHPATDRYLTVEQALQEFFLYHWQDHLRELQPDDSIHYEPPETPNVV